MEVTKLQGRVVDGFPRVSLTNLIREAHDGRAEPSQNLASSADQSDLRVMADISWAHLAAAAGASVNRKPSANHPQLAPLDTVVPADQSTSCRLHRHQFLFRASPHGDEGLRQVA